MGSSTLLGKIKVLATRHPMIRGVVSYAILWPTSSAIQQMIEGTSIETFDWKRCARFSIFGAFFVAPTLYGWVRLSSAMWPATNIKSGLIKAAIEQISYGPFAMTSFFVGMNLLESKSFGDGVSELKEKFVPTWKVGICVWPIVQTINFSVVPEPNRVVFVSVVSVMWTIFLAYMKQIDKDKQITEIT